MTTTENLLQILSEECVETAQRVSKAIRFTLEEIQPGQELTNAERIVYEFNDIVAVMEVLHEKGFFHTVIDRIAINKKKAKIDLYTQYSKERGTVVDDWLPIETAPKDGTQIIICEGLIVDFAAWEPERDWQYIEEQVFDKRGELTHYIPKGGWVGNGLTSDEGDREFNPTHWRPGPKPFGHKEN